jgi:hypothetical protein
MKNGVDSLPEFTWIGKVDCYQVGMVKTFGSEKRFVVGIRGSAKILEVVERFAVFPFSLETSTCRFQGFECGSEPRIGFW